MLRDLIAKFKEFEQKSVEEKDDLKVKISKKELYVEDVQKSTEKLKNA